MEFPAFVGAWEMLKRAGGGGKTWFGEQGAWPPAFAAILTGRTNREVTVHLPGGDLRVEWNRQSGHVFMTGGATEVFSGEVSDF